MPTRRLALAATLLVASLAAPACGQPGPAPAGATERPNILWISCEDIGPDLGCYGAADARTPNLDRLAARGVRYTRAFAPIGVCAPSRSTIITGVYACSLGTHPMRCRAPRPEGVREFPRLLRAAGYYTTNNVKTDYNFEHHPDTWDACTVRAHWRNRPAGRPFFSVFNFTTTHEGQIRLPDAEFERRAAALGPGQRHDPAAVTLPPYHPDHPDVRRDWARYHDNISLMDRQVGALLGQLEADGLADSTIVVFFSDHGAGLPRHKRWLYDSSLRVPLIVHVPARFRSLAAAAPGTVEERLVSLADLAPTMLGLAGVEPPGWLQGVAFLGPAAGAPRRFVHGFRDRMDERTDMLRTVRDSRYHYIRNYLPQLAWFRDRPIAYMEEMPTMRAWRRRADAGALSGPAAAWMAPAKPPEELYDTEADPWETTNLAGDPAHRATLDAMRAELRRWQDEVVDLGFLPEADLRSRFGAASGYDVVRRDPASYPLAAIRAVADDAVLDPSRADALAAALDHADPAARWWAATGLGGLGPRAEPFLAPLALRLSDPAPWVRVAAADAIARAGRPAEAVGPLIAALADANPWVRHEAAEALDRLGPAAEPAAGALRRVADGDDNEYARAVAAHAVRAPAANAP